MVGAKSTGYYRVSAVIFFLIVGIQVADFFINGTEVLNNIGFSILFFALGVMALRRAAQKSETE